MKLKRLAALALAILLLLTLAPASLAAQTQAPAAHLAPLSEAYQAYLELSSEEQAALRTPLAVDRPSSLELSSMGESAALPERFDAREAGYLAPVKDQMNTNSCWTFSSTSNLANYLNKTAPLPGGKSYDFSPKHLEFSTALFPTDLQNPWALSRTADTGGNQFPAIAYFLRGSGPVDNAGAMAFSRYPQSSGGNVTVPYPARADLFQKVSAQVMDYLFYPDLDETQLAESLAALRAQMKQGVLDYGSVDVGILWENQSKNFNRDHNCFYNPNTRVSTNHAVLLVGWDDNFPRENFNSGRRPRQDGAWIIQNSWGTDTQESGFFYVSYEELSLYELSGTVTGAQNAVDYDNAYVLDPLGLNQRLNFFPGDDVLYAANVFTRTGGQESLTAVTFASAGNVDYEVYVTDGTLSAAGTPVASGSLSSSMGYTTVEINPVPLEGDKFAVIVAYSSSDGTGGIPLESKLEGSYSSASAPSGSSFYSDSKTGGWVELSTAQNYSSNCCIKAFTKNTSGRTIVSFERDDPKSVVTVFSTSGQEIPCRADGTFSLAQNTAYAYQCSVYTSDIQPDGSHVKRIQNVFTTGSKPSQNVKTGKNPIPFTDVGPLDWYYEAVKFCYEENYISGTTATAFSPAAPSTRAALATILWRMSGSPSPQGESPFTDVAPGAWYSDAVAWAAEQGVVTGVGGGQFAPDRMVTRQDFAVMLCRYQTVTTGKSPSFTGDLSRFADRDTAAGYAVNALSWCVEQGILNGRTSTTLAPQGQVLRSETAAMLYRLVRAAPGSRRTANGAD